MLNAADFGAYTSRNRLFMIFAKKHLVISFPETSHSRKPYNDQFGKRQAWLPVRDVLDFEDEGASIFERKKPLVDNTLKRIYAGLVQYVQKNRGTDFLTHYYGTATAYSVDKPAGTNKLNLVTAEGFLLNPQWGGQFSTLWKPCFTLIARMDKMPPYIVQPHRGESRVAMQETDSVIMRKIKTFIAENGITDVKMRMLKIKELSRIQGFPDSYQFHGTETEIKKYIGNAVHPLVPKAMVLHLSACLVNHKCSQVLQTKLIIKRHGIGF